MSLLRKTRWGLPAVWVMGVGALLTLIVFVNSLFVVPQTQTAMVIALGKVVRENLEPGLHVKVPFYQNAQFFDKRILATYSDPEEVQSLDKKRLVVDSFTRWQISDVAQFYRSVRNINTAMARLNTIVNSNIRAVVASYTLLDLLDTDRQEAMHQILMASAKEAAPLGIKIIDVRIKRTDLPPENSEAIFRRMRAERQKEAREIRAEGEEMAQKIRAQGEASRTIILADAEKTSLELRGEGDAKAFSMTGRAYAQDPQFFRLMKGLETARAVVQASDTLLILDGKSPAVRVLVD
ncbi:MAG: protease modulator HflC [Alphaproteobacteria bacterium CG_4_10_14_0_8_um_filter_53_9]|nr:MAG: protease modulator HflC [Alphaproteobacteria bacterium CG_4_10_14_0_8_um_filter_53_9]